MSADRPQPPIPPGYRTFVPGRGPVVPGQGEKPPAQPAAKTSAASPAPKPGAATAVPAKPGGEGEKPHDDPTRFGDWQVKGRCIDF